MMEFIKNSAFFGAMISLIAYEIGLILKKKFKMAIFNPLLISIICVIGVLLIFHIDYDDYNDDINDFFKEFGIDNMEGDYNEETV